MKKITFLALSLCLSFTTIKAQFVIGQTLPLDHNVFFRAAALGIDPTLELGQYTGTDEASIAIMQNQWNRSGKAADQGGASPSVEASTLSYSNYIDNNNGKAINLAALGTGLLHSSIYSLTSGSEYVGTTFYAGLLVKLTEVTSTGDDFFAFDANFTANKQRGRIFIKASANTGFYNAGIGYSAKTDVTTWSGDLALGTTYFFVASISVAATGTETITLYINPIIGSLESANTPVNSGSYTAALNKLRGLTVRQRPGFAGKIAGLRFSNSWTDVVKASTYTGLINPSVTNFATVTNKKIQFNEIGNVEICNLQGAKLVSAVKTNSINTNLSKGLYIVKFTNSTNQKFTQKIVVQ